MLLFGSASMQLSVQCESMASNRSRCVLVVLLVLVLLARRSRSGVCWCC